jgi:Trypsin-like serine proteases, typically periplasmic, contain C-terminal PDZ domain
LQAWHQNADGDIELSNASEPADVDDRYLTSHAYWQPKFSGAAVTVLAPQTQGWTTWDRLQFKVPGGKGFTLWINRETGLLDRIEGSSAKQLSDYRSVDGVMLPFVEKKAAGDGEFIVTYSSRKLRPHVDSSAFAIPFRRDYQMPASGVVTVPAKGGLIFEAKINGKGPFKALFDTGALNFMSASFAHRLGLKLETEGVKFGTSSPASMQVHKAHVDTLQIGDLVLHDQTFFVSGMPDDGPDEGGTPQFIVGYELLRRFAIKVDYAQQRLTFYDGPDFHYTGSGSVVPLELQSNGNGIFVEASIGKASGRFIIDTGNEFGFSLTTKFTTKNNLVQTLRAHFLGYNGRGFAGPSPEAYLVRVNHLRIGDVPSPSVIAHLTTDPSDKSDLAGNIGQSILGNFTEVFDCMRGKLYFEKTKDSDRSEIFNRAGLIFDSFGHGLQVMTVLPGSPGAEAGLQVGDIIATVDGKVPPDDGKQPAFLKAAGTVLHLSVRRGSETRVVNVTLRDIL